jgi:hypothetical protein
MEFVRFEFQAPALDALVTGKAERHRVATVGLGLTRLVRRQIALKPRLTDDVVGMDGGVAADLAGAPETGR